MCVGSERGMETSTVVVAQAKSKSLRATIPAAIARQFLIGEGTELGWDIEPRDNRLVIVVHPLTAEERATLGLPPQSKTIVSPVQRGRGGRE